jgi:hypothetical protein
MKLSEVKNIIKLAKSGQDILIENDIYGYYGSEITSMGGKRRRFKPKTDKSFWSQWRVGIPYRWKGKDVVLWVRGYHCSAGEPLMWLCDSIWVIKTNKEMRKDASVNCWDHVRTRAKEIGVDISDIRANKIDPEDTSRGWKVTHLGIEWTIEPNISMSNPDNSSGFWVRCTSLDGKYASLKDTVKEAKAFIKYDSGEWLSNNQIKSI